MPAIPAKDGLIATMFHAFIRTLVQQLSGGCLNAIKMEMGIARATT
jgi:hypothetical protein